MNVLYLGVPPFRLTSIIESSGAEIVYRSAPFDVNFLRKNEIDIAVSHRYRHIIGKDEITYLNGKIVNLHNSFLPWNKGADANPWSFLEDTPKGATLHFIDVGIDTGDIIGQTELHFDEDSETLSSSYSKVQDALVALFEKHWPSILSGECPRIPQTGEGSYHTTSERNKWLHLIDDLGWNTPASHLKGMALKNDTVRS